MKRMLIGLAAVLVTATATWAAEPAMVADSSLGKVWVDAKGMTLYVFDKDTENQSNCYDQCATNWPPLMAGADAKAEGEWTVVERKDGTKMWSYEGHPLYTYIKDQKPGDVVGDGVGGVWHAAKDED